ncbi:MAG: stage V sporulation protein AD [Oscillospiraceae bacterium]|nr:stage V sporulation protein AD [Oscillospiraceae bacterium]
MAIRLGRGTAELASRPAILGQAAVGGQTEQEGPLGHVFAQVFAEAHLGEKCWEMAETRLQQASMSHALERAHCAPEGIDLHLGGDLLNQCSATSFALRELGIPLAGIYSACASFAQALAMGALALESGAFGKVSACASSHFCAAEKQFRFPLEFGGQAPPTAQRTATAAGAAILGTGVGPRISRVIFGKVTDLGVKNANEMGAAMAPAAWDTLKRFLQDTESKPGDFDMILTGDLGGIGSALLQELARTEAGLDIASVHQDCGLLLYDTEEQDAGVGGSGVGCSAAVLCGEIFPKLQSGELRRVLFLGTGALLSAVSPLQGESIPAVAHGVELTADS